MEDISACICGEHVAADSAGALQCKRTGCETQWYHLDCVGLEMTPRRWICDACEGTKRRR
ncbi:hypothetical protein DENSPDRAFT_789904 [Dentipellis sp. KUC8613]|nr:hypothetical protein DENSPDRAFT_789904 [Dentipellis sp. KUC8613]